MNSHKAVPGRPAFLLAFLVAAGCAPAPQEPDSRPHSVVFLIADGAGMGHVSVALEAIEDPALRRLPHTALVDSRGSDRSVGGSAPTATGFATGVKTFMRALGLGPDSQPRGNIMELARSRNMGTGLVTTTYIPDATPMAFVVHALRYQWNDILPQLLEFRPDVLAGGGRGIFEENASVDGISFLDLFEESYGRILDRGTFSEFDASSASSMMAILADGDMPLAPERNPTLAELTSAALAVLSNNPNGFVLMVENEETDTQAHNNQPYDVIAAEMIAFDQVVQVALDYRLANPETLVLVAADHETGGMSISNTSGPPRLSYHTGGHTSEPVPLFAVGPGAHRFDGIMTNAEVGQVLLELLRPQ